MNVKPDKTTRIFTVDQRWMFTREAVEKILCDHIGIPYDDNTYVTMDSGPDVEVGRVVVDRQSE